MVVKVCGMSLLKIWKPFKWFNRIILALYFMINRQELFIKEISNFKNTKKIGVFVDENIEVILSKQKQFNLDGIQLHGNENVDKIKKLKKSLPKNMKFLKPFPSKTNLILKLLRIMKNVLIKSF